MCGWDKRIFREKRSHHVRHTAADIGTWIKSGKVWATWPTYTENKAVWAVCSSESCGGRRTARRYCRRGCYSRAVSRQHCNWGEIADKFMSLCLLVVAHKLWLNPNLTLITLFDDVGVHYYTSLETHATFMYVLATLGPNVYNLPYQLWSAVHSKSTLSDPNQASTAYTKLWT